MLFYLLSVLGLVPTFRNTKCKRLLNTTMERIKLLEKRRQTRLRQLQRDVIELLKLGKQHKVQPWLMRIWKERCLCSVYIKIEDYCQFVQINLKDIAAQRECPSGLEEPLAGLCFAASCCADLPELQELREIFAMKYGRQFVNSAQDLQSNCHVNQEFLECLCAKDPSETQKQELLKEITTLYNVKQGHEQDTQQQEIHDTLSIEGFVDMNECNQLQEGIDDTMKVSEVEDQSEREELQEVEEVQGSNHIKTVCEEDLGSTELANELANRKRTLEDRELRRSAFKRAYRRRKFWLNKAMEEEENGCKEHEKTPDKVHDCVDENGQGDEVFSNAGRRLGNVHHDACEGCGALQGEGITAHMNEVVAPKHILLYVEQPSRSQPPHRLPPPPPPPKRAPLALPSLRVVSMPSSYNDKQAIANKSLPLSCSPPALPSLRVVSMPSSYNDKQAIANKKLPLSCSTMANNYYLETYGSYVHPRLPKYEDLVANFTARKH